MYGFQQRQSGMGQSFGLRLKSIDWKSRQSSVKLVPNYHKISESVKEKDPSDVKHFRDALQITITEDVPENNPILSFSQANFPDFIQLALQNSNYQKPTPIQCQGWPVAFQGKNLIGVAETGSGKTLAFLIPAILHCIVQRKHEKETGGKVFGPRVVVLSPTRELAKQIHSECFRLIRDTHLKSVCCSGGASRSQQALSLSDEVDFVIGTPGRIIDFLENGITKFSETTMFIVDEADRMLDMGFEKQLRRIHSQIPPSRQTLFFTATWPQGVVALARDFVIDPVKVNIGAMDASAVHSVKQLVKVLDRRDRFEFLTQSIIPGQLETGGKILIFTSTKATSNFLYGKIRELYSQALLMHGDKRQEDRDVVIRDFSVGRCPILVATDVAQRGLDIPKITCVVNYDFPGAIEDYIHRIGRTGRAGNDGVAWSLFTRDDERMASSLIRVLAEAKQEIPVELKDLAENGIEAEITRNFPLPWAERTEEEKEMYRSTPIEMKQPQDYNELAENNDGQDDFGQNSHGHDDQQATQGDRRDNDRRDNDRRDNDRRENDGRYGDENRREDRREDRDRSSRRHKSASAGSGSGGRDSSEERYRKLKKELKKVKAKYRDSKKSRRGDRH